MQIIQRNVLTPRFVVFSLKLSREKLLFLLPWWRVSQRDTPRRAAPMRACMESAKYEMACTYACTHTRPRSRACVHFHRRARRNCKVAYMQGVKLGSRRFDPRPRIERYRSVATEHNSCNAGWTSLRFAIDSRLVRFPFDSIDLFDRGRVIRGEIRTVIFDFDWQNDRISGDYIFIESLRSSSD